jgi:aspartate carbamoyltransferase catalytic subunit
MQNYRDVRLVFIAPPQFAMGDDVKAHLRSRGIPFVDDARLDDVIGDLDALYVTRMQSEWDTAGETSRVNYAEYSITPDNIGRLKPDAAIMHPLPRGPEVDPSCDDDPRAVYWRQERNGMWMRVAILLKIFQADRLVHEVDLDAID